MLGASHVETLRDSSTSRTLMVRCPEHQVPANVVAVKWQLASGQWTPWEIVDCPLLPAGFMHCGMKCVSQLDGSGQ
jgi:hypothetical protein